MMVEFGDNRLPERFWEKIVVVYDCWIWTGASGKKRYGNFRDPVTKKTRKAHIVAYRFLIGEIPAELELDHTCRRPECVNPDHCEPVTHRVNVLRGTGPTSENFSKTHCKNGHELIPENIKFRKRDGYDHRVCLICEYEYNARRPR